jgi:hypothetical protein
MFSFLKKRRKPAFEKFLKPFNSACELLLTLAKDDDGNPRRFDPIDMSTSAAAIIGAAYVSKRTTVLLGRASETEMGPFLDEVNSLFQFVAGSCIREFERQEGRKIDLQSEEAWGLVEELCHIQEEKMARYIVALCIIRAKGPGCSVGGDLSREVVRDVYGEEFFDVVFSTLLFTLVVDV